MNVFYKIDLFNAIRKKTSFLAGVMRPIHAVCEHFAPVDNTGRAQGGFVAIGHRKYLS
jgi:hypothetical protein